MNAAAALLILLVIIVLLILIWYLFSYDYDHIERNNSLSSVAILSTMNGEKIESRCMTLYDLRGRRFLLSKKSDPNVRQIEDNPSVCILIIEKNLDWVQRRYQGNLCLHKKLGDVVIFEFTESSYKANTTKITKTEIVESTTVDGVLVNSTLFASTYFDEAVNYLKSI